MRSIAGVEPPQDSCSCQLCMSLRAYGAEYDIETRDTLPPMPVTIAEKTSATLLAEIRAALGGGGW